MRRREPIVLIATRKLRFALPSIDRLLEEQRFAAAGRFHLAVGPFRDQQIGLDRNGDALQFARFFESVDELAERRVSHLALVRRTARAPRLS